MYASGPKWRVLFSLSKRPFSARSTYLGSEICLLCDVLSSVRVSCHGMFLSSSLSNAQSVRLVSLNSEAGLWYTQLTLYLLAYVMYSLTCSCEVSLSSYSRARFHGATEHSGHHTPVGVQPSLVLVRSEICFMEPSAVIFRVFFVLVTSSRPYHSVLLCQHIE